jgi:hypothetical protein
MPKDALADLETIFDCLDLLQASPGTARGNCRSFDCKAAFH